MVKEFNYTTANGTHTRKVFVVNDSANHIGGYDLNLLSSRQASMLVNKNSGFTATDSTSVHDLAKRVGTWDKAYRNFTKSKIESL